MQLPDYSGQGVEGITNADAMNNSKLQDQHFQQQMNVIIARKREEKAREAKANAKVEKYLNAMPDGIDTSKLPAKYKPGVQEWAKNKQLEFAQLAQQAADLESNGDFTNSIAIKNRMTEIENSFKNVDNQLLQFKSYKDGFLEDSQNGMVSNSVNTTKRDLLSSVYTDEFNMTFSDDGSITFLNEEGGYVNFDEIPDYTVKNNKGASEILNMNETAYKSGEMSPSAERIYRMKLQNITKSRDEVLSLATDDFITEGGLGILDDDLLYNEERTDELRSMVIDTYMDMFKTSSSEGAKVKAAKSNRGSGGRRSGGSASDRKYNTMVSNFLEGYNALQDKDPIPLLRYLPGDYNITKSDQVKGAWEFQKGSGTTRIIDPKNAEDFKHVLALTGVPQNYWPDLVTPEEETVSDNNEVDTSFED
jgi:hypothetical protein